MRRTLIIGGSVSGLIILIVAGLLAYAVLNLNSIIAQRRGYILGRLSDAIGRPVTVDTIKASLGWGVLIDFSGVQIADDPAFSQLPLATVKDLYLKVEFLPLLLHSVRITEMRLTHPVVRVIRNRAAQINLTAIARKRATRLPPPAGSSGTSPNPSTGMINSNPQALAQPAEHRAGAAISIHRMTLTDGVFDYIDESVPNAAPVELQDVQAAVDNFSLDSRFDMDLSFAVFGSEKNFDMHGTIGPLITSGALDLNAIPLNLKAELGPLTFSQLRSLPQVARALPLMLAVTGPINLTASASGTVDAINFTLDSDLSPNLIDWQPFFTKPAGTTMTVSAQGIRTAEHLTVAAADFTVASAKAQLTQIDLASGNLAGHIRTNDFAIAPLAAMIPLAARYHPAGVAAIDAAVRLGPDHHPAVNGIATLSAAALAIPEAGGGAVPITQLSGPLRLNGNTAHIGPLAFNLGSAHAGLEATAQSLHPLRLSYQFSADKLVPAELIPSRQRFAPEYLGKVTANGTASVAGRPAGALNLTTATGLIQNVPFTNLALAATYAAGQVSLNAIAFNSCDGAISGNGVATLGAVPSFDLSLATRGLDLQKALTAVKAKAANTVRGQLTGKLSISGHGEDFERIRQALRGSGQAQVINAKLVGVNVAAQGLRKIDHLPAIGSLVPGSVINRHPELFASPDTDIQSASLTFTIFGPRLTTRDFIAQATDYNATASGWFDLDKNLDMNAQIILSQPFSDEVIAARKNVAFLAGRDGQIVIPLRITGRLPHPNVMPNVDILAQRAASHAVQDKIGGLLNKGDKGLGGLFHGKNPLQGFFR